jgi:hypothetical protein
MKKTAAIGALVIAPSLMFAAAASQAATVQFTDLDDAFPQFFDLATTTPSGNVLTIGLDAFAADAGGGTPAQIGFDTITFRIVTQPGYYVTKVVYTEGGDVSRAAPNVGDVALTVATGSWVVNGMTGGFDTILGTSPTNGTVSWEISAQTPGFTAADDMTNFLVSITNNIQAVAVGGTADARIEKTYASVEVFTAVIPLPPSVWLLGSALFGVGVLGRRMKRESRLAA